ncbi:MAG: UPF0175 family protein [Firmicutes bacterium]|nr:UPF0175 family protein [Bacillota bacterium]
MGSITQITIPESIALSLREPVEKIGLEMKRALAIIYYCDKKLSLGQCSELAEMTKAEFIKHLSKYNISIFSYSSEDELLEDIANA